MMAEQGSILFSDGLREHLRFPEGLREHLKQAAKAANRSMNSEIVHRLRAYEDNMTAPTDDLPRAEKSATITVRLTSEMRAKLDALAQRGPYRISITSIIERGVELAAKELEAIGSGQ